MSGPGKGRITWTSKSGEQGQLSPEIVNGQAVIQVFVQDGGSGANNRAISIPLKVFLSAFPEFYHGKVEEAQMCDLVVQAFDAAPAPFQGVREAYYAGAQDMFRHLRSIGYL